MKAALLSTSPRLYLEQPGLAMEWGDVGHHMVTWLQLPTARATHVTCVTM